LVYKYLSNYDSAKKIYTNNHETAVILAPGLVPGDFPFGLALAVGAMAIAVPEMSKTPESPPGFYGFDPLNLKDAPLPPEGAGGGTMERFIISQPSRLDYHV